MKEIIKLLSELEEINEGKFESELTSRDIERIEKIGKKIYDNKLLVNNSDKDLHIQIMMKNNVSSKYYTDYE